MRFTVLALLIAAACTTQSTAKPVATPAKVTVPAPKADTAPLCCGMVYAITPAETLAAYQKLAALVPAAKQRASHATVNYNLPSQYDSLNAYWADVAGITGDVDAAVTLAFWYGRTGDTAAARVAANLIRGWAKTNKTVSGSAGALSMAEMGAGLLLAANRLPLNAGDKYWLDLWIKNTLRPVCVGIYANHTNNWADWAVYCEAWSDKYLGDTAGLDSVKNVRIGKLIANQFAANGSLPQELARGAGAEVWYTYFALDPLIGAEVLCGSEPGAKTKLALNYLLDSLLTNGKLTQPRPQDPWPAELFEAMGAYYKDTAFLHYAEVKRPVEYLGHHYVYPFATLDQSITN